MNAPAIPLVITPMGVCKHRDRFCPHDARTYRHAREMGYNAVIFGFLDQWDEDLSFLEYYGRSEAVPGLIPAGYRERNRAELRRRLDITRQLGLSVYMSIASPLGPKSKMYLDNRDPMQSGGSYAGGFCNDPRGQFGEYLGPDEELCVGHADVRRYYRELIADIVTSFPEIRGFTIFGGDFYSSMCRRGACPRCGDTPAWRRFAVWADGITRAARAVRPGVEMYIINWPWWQEAFDILAITDPSIGFMLSSCWGFAFGAHGERYPSLTAEWWMYDANSGQAPLATGERPRTLCELHDPWSTIGPAGTKMLRFVEKAKRRGNPVIVLDELSTSEAVMPFFMPNPLTTLEKLRQWRALGLHGVLDWWGLHRQEAEGWHVDVNRRAVREFLRRPDAGDDVILATVAAEVYGPRAAKDALAAWRAIKGALDGWAIISWHQRMNWPVMMWQDAFYHRDLTAPPPRPEHPPLPGQAAQDDCPLDVWRALAASLDRVISGYGTALDAYGQVVAKTDPARQDEARFHRDSVELGRCFHVLGRHTCEAQLARRDERPVDAGVMEAAIANLVRIVELSDRVGTFEYRRDWYVDAIANMRRARRRRGPVRDLRLLPGHLP
jgi:hypothetical protein